jgi:hypothetical protein
MSTGRIFSDLIARTLHHMQIIVAICIQTLSNKEYGGHRRTMPAMWKRYIHHVSIGKTLLSLGIPSTYAAAFHPHPAHNLWISSMVKSRVIALAKVNAVRNRQLPIASIRTKGLFNRITRIEAPTNSIGVSLIISSSHTYKRSSIAKQSFNEMLIPTSVDFLLLENMHETVRLQVVARSQTHCCYEHLER